MRTAVIYLLTVAGCALGSGIFLDVLYTNLDVGEVGHCAWMLPAWLKTVCALALFSVLGYALATRASVKKKH